MNIDFKYFNIIAIACLSILLNSCIDIFGSSASEVKIKGGQYVDNFANPMARSTVALIQAENIFTGKTLCSGTLIANDMVLTAAHCFLHADKQNLRVVFFPKVANASNEYIRKVKRVLIHEEFLPDAAKGRIMATPNDIALVTFENEKPASAEAVGIIDAGITLPHTMWLTGFGLQSETDLKSSGFLKTIEAAVVNVDDFKKTIVFQNDDSDPNGALPGDSGGPAYVKINNYLQIAGVDSTGGVAQGGGYNGQNTYTFVDKYREWIASAATKIRDPNTQIEPIANIIYYITRKSKSEFSITITNNNSEAHFCTFKATANMVLGSFQNTIQLMLKYNLIDTQIEKTLGFRLEPLSSGKNYATFYAIQPKENVPIKDFLIYSQCDSAPSSPPAKPSLSWELEQEIQQIPQP